MNKNTGFTLVEVLTTMIILSIGLLGLAAIQATSLKNNLSAYYRGQATQIAYDMADRMRANKLSALSNSYLTASATVASHTECNSTTGCSATDMAENDLYEWQDAGNSYAAIKALPSGEATITSPSASLYKIEISWDDDRDGNVDSSDPSFEMSFQL